MSHQQHHPLNAAAAAAAAAAATANLSIPNHQHQQQHHHHQNNLHNLHLANKQHQQHHEQLLNSSNNSSSNASTPNSTSFLIKDILRYEGQKRKQRKARTAFSDHQLRELEASFEAKKYLTVQDRVELAAKLKLSDTQVKTWYQNRRTKHKRQTAVGYELLAEASHLYAYQQVLHQQTTNWMFNNCAPPNTQFNLAAAAALLAAQASVQSGSLESAQQQQLNGNNMTQQQQVASTAANSSNSPMSPHSPQDQRSVKLDSDNK